MNTITEDELKTISNKYYNWKTSPITDLPTTPHFEHLPEYYSLSQIPNEDWFLFCVLKYDEPPPVDSKYLFNDVYEWLGKVGETIGIKPSQMDWFCRVEEVDDGYSEMPTHLHVIVGKKFLDRTVHNSKLKLWTVEALQFFLNEHWEHGLTFIERYNPSQDGVGYALKRTLRSKNCEDVFISSALKKRIREGGDNEQHAIDRG